MGFGLGSFRFGGSDSKSDTTNNTDNSNVGGGMLENSQAGAIKGDNNTISFLDGGAINDAFSFGKTAFNTSLEEMRRNSESAFNFADDSSRRSYDFANNSLSQIATNNNSAFSTIKDVVGQAFGATNNSLREIRTNNDQALGFARQVANSEGSQGVEALISILPMLAIVGGLAYVLKK